MGDKPQRIPNRTQNISNWRIKSMTKIYDKITDFLMNSYAIALWILIGMYLFKLLFT